MMQPAENTALTGNANDTVALTHTIFITCFTVMSRQQSETLQQCVTQ